MTMRVMPPANGLRPTIVVNGRTYTCALGSTITMPDQDALVACANGWINASYGGAGATAARPTNPKQGQEFHDDTLGKVIRFDGINWRDPSTGATA